MKKPHWLFLKASVKVNHTQQTWILLRGEREGKKEDEWRSEEAECPIHSFRFPSSPSGSHPLLPVPILSFRFPSSQTLEKKQNFSWTRMGPWATSFRWYKKMCPQLGRQSWRHLAHRTEWVRGTFKPWCLFTSHTGDVCPVQTSVYLWLSQGL